MAKFNSAAPTKASAKPDGAKVQGTYSYSKGGSGVSQSALKSQGRNMARANNQRGK